MLRFLSSSFSLSIYITIFHTLVFSYSVFFFIFLDFSNRSCLGDQIWHCGVAFRATAARLHFDVRIWKRRLRWRLGRCHFLLHSVQSSLQRLWLSVHVWLWPSSLAHMYLLLYYCNSLVLTYYYLTLSKNFNCRVSTLDSKSRFNVKIARFSALKPGDEQAIKAYINSTGPVAAYVTHLNQNS